MHPWISAAFVVAAVAADAAHGQGLDLRVPEPVDPARAGIRAIEADGRTVTLEVVRDGHEHPIVFVQGVSRWDVGELPDGRWVVLAGGVESGLDLYLFDPRTGDLGRPFRTADGLRLPATFGGGVGSWPRTESAHLFAFVVEREVDRKCVFYAVDFSHQVPQQLASIELPSDVRDFALRFDAATQRVRVEFEGAEAVVEFNHPLAPQLEIEPRLVDFGRVQAGAEAHRDVLLRNVGRSVLRTEVGVDGEAFRAGGVSRSLVIPAGGTANVAVEFVPLRLGELRGSLRIRSRVAGASAVVSLRGESMLSAIEVPVPAVDTQPAAAELTPGPDRPRVTEPPVPVQRPALLALQAAEISDLVVRRLDARRVWVHGRLNLDPTRFPTVLFEEEGLEFVVVNHTTEAVAPVRIGRSRMIDLCVRAVAGDALGVAMRDSRADPRYVAFAVIQPRIARIGDEIEARVAPGGAFLLLGVEPNVTGESPEKVLRSWRGKADARGVARIPLADLGSLEGIEHLVVAEAADAELVHSAILTLDP